MWECSYCPFASSRKWNTQVHEKRKHQDQISTSNGNDQRKTNEYYPVQGGETPIVYQQHVQEQHPLDVVHHHCPQPVLHQPVQTQQGWTQQQGGRVHALYPQHNSKQAEVNNQSQYKYVKVLDLDSLILENNIEYVLQNVKHFLGCFPLDSLPPFPTTFPKSMIINTQASTQTGEHWVALVLTEKQCYYFDSFALPIQPNIYMYLQAYCESICRSVIRIQDSTSNYCGGYCVCFVLHVKDDVSYNNFIAHYNSNYLSQNDEKLKQDFSKIDFLVEM